jgi:phage-related minor tail protein
MAVVRQDAKTSNLINGHAPVIVTNPQDFDNNAPVIASDLDISKDVKGTLRSGFQTVVAGGHFDARATIVGLAQSLANRAAGNLFDTIYKAWVTSANGNVLKGGFKAFAKGGIVNKPTMGLIGEGKYNEAVVPLPDGRSIPVSGAMSGDNNITVNVTIDSEGTSSTQTEGITGESAKQIGYMVSQAVQVELVEQQRPGGLLSQY